MSTRTSSESHRRPIILVIDDDEMTRISMRRGLEAAGMSIQEASTGEAAMASIDRSKPDLIVLDVMLPGMDGVDLCARLRQRSDAAEIPVLVISGRSESEMRQVVLDAGASAYLGKPIRMTNLVRQVQELLGKPSPGHPH